MALRHDEVSAAGARTAGVSVSGRRTIVPLSFSPSNADAAFVMETLQQRGVSVGQRSAVMWALMAAQLRGVATGVLLAGVEAHPDARFVMHQLAAVAQLPQEDTIDVAEIARLMEVW